MLDEVRADGIVGGAACSPAKRKGRMEVLVQGIEGRVRAAQAGDVKRLLRIGYEFGAA